MTRMCWQCLLVAGVLGVAGIAQAEPFWRKLPLVKRVESDPNRAYALTEDHGPWLVLATTFTGEPAEQKAHELVLELRKEYNLKAYTHRMKFEFGNTRGRGLNRYGEALRMRYRKEAVKEVAVLVGDFPSVDDSQAERTLQKLKYMEPKCLAIATDPEDESRPLSAFRNMMRRSSTGKYVRYVKREMGPMAGAHMTTNPLLPDEYYAPKGLDPFVVEMNEGVQHSLLDCKGLYSVKVATFSGRVIIDQRRIEEIESGSQVESKLAEAADQAHRLTVALREQGYEAYEFHDRGQSIVTVGSFNSYGTPRADGKIEINPEIHALMTTFGAQKQLAGQAIAQIGQPKEIAGIRLDLQPMIVQVPRQSISATYADRGLFNWR